MAVVAILLAAAVAPLGAPSRTYSARNGLEARPASSLCATATPWGDPLRGCWVSYPATPHTAPDRLPYGTVGPVGPQGQVGAATFAQGAATTLGTAPATSAGADTLISGSSFWGNESVSLVGNVTIAPGASLTVWNSALTFTEPPVADGYAYGFNVSDGGAGTLLLEHGAEVTQSSPATTRPWFLWGTGSDAYPGADNFTVDVSNSTLIAESTSRLAGSPHVAGGYFTPPAMTGLEISWFNWSTYEGGGNWNVSYALNATLGAQHSSFEGGIAQIVSAGNDSFDRTQVGFNVGIGTRYQRSAIVLQNDEIANTSEASPYYVTNLDGIGDVQVLPASNQGPGAVFVNRSLFYDINTSFGPKAGNPDMPANQYGLTAYAAGWPGGVFVQNTTIENVWNAPNTGAELIGGTQNGNAIPWNERENLNVSIRHDTILNVTVNAANGAGPNGIMPIAGAGAPWVESYEYNLIDGYRTTQGGVESNIFGAGGWNVSVDWNVWENISSVAAQPPGSGLGNQGDWSGQDNGYQLYSTGVGVSWPGNYASAPAPYNTPYPDITHAAYPSEQGCLCHNFVRDIGPGQIQWFQVTGAFAKVAWNTIVDVNDSTSISVSFNSGADYNVVEDNSVYGAYNYTGAIGGMGGGGSNHTTWSSNAVYDVDTTSWAFVTWTAYDTWANSTGSLFLLQQNRVPVFSTFNPCTGPDCFSGETTVLRLNDSVITALNVSAYANDTYNTWASPYPSRYNVSVARSYVPGSLTQLALNWSRDYPGAYQVPTAGRSNPGFLSVTGYLGAFEGQAYDVIGTWGGSQTQVDFNGAEAAIFPASPGSWYSFEALSFSEYEIGASSRSAPPATVAFSGLVPGFYYQAIVTNSSTGAAVAVQTATANAQGVASFTYVPSSMPLDPTFAVSCASATCGPAPSAGALLAESFLGIPAVAWLVGAALLVAVGVGLELGRRHR